MSKCLIPGYTHQLFSYGRGKMYNTGQCLKEKNLFLKYTTGPTVNILNKASELLELPIRLIEDIALSIINLLGAIFSRGCRENLKHCFQCLKKDILDSLCIAPIIALSFFFSFVPVVYGVIQVGNAILKGQENLHEKRDEQFADFYRINALRKHGCNKLVELENLLPKIMQKIPELLLPIYKNIAKLNEQEFCDYLNEIKAVLEPEEIEEVESHHAECAEELENDQTLVGKTAAHILQLSQNIDFSKMSPLQIRGHLCNLLGLRINSEKISETINTIRLILYFQLGGHDENNKNYYEKALLWLNYSSSKYLETHPA